MAKFRAIHNIHLTQPRNVWGKIHVIERGAYVDKTLDGTEAPVDSVVFSGGIIEAELTPRELRIMARDGYAEPLEESKLHTDLESIFGPDIAEVLRANDIWSLEDVASEKEITVNGSEIAVGEALKRPLRELLERYAADAAEVNDWLLQAQIILEVK